MSLTSLQFFCLFLLSVGIYYVIPKKLQWYALLAFSIYFFCVSSSLSSSIYLLANIVVTTACAKIIGGGQKQNNDRLAVAALVIGVVTNIGMLSVLKYSNFLVSNLNLFASFFHLQWNLYPMKLAAPIGISFYTMQTIGYLLDVYWGKEKPQENILKTALFVAYYPQLTSGPIARWHDVKDQLYCGHQFQWETIVSGLQRMVFGIFKKTVLSARIGIVVDTIYGNTEVYNGFYIWLAAFAFMMQLYTDFSGCMDIIAGASECYGIILPENFKNPFSSRTVQEFWQRWHITLGTWMKDYILYPILHAGTYQKFTKFIKRKFGKKAAKQVPVYLGMLGVWLLIGLWHGGGWKYIIGQGIWFWGCIVLSQALAPIFKKLISFFRINTESFSWHMFQQIRVYTLVSIGNMFFRLDSLRITLQTMKAGLQNCNLHIFFDGSLYQLGLDVKECHILLLSFLFMAAGRMVQVYGNGDLRQWFSKQNLVFRWSCMYLLLFWIIIFGCYGEAYDASAFIYAGF